MLFAAIVINRSLFVGVKAYKKAFWWQGWDWAVPRRSLVVCYRSDAMCARLVMHAIQVGRESRMSQPIRRKRQLRRAVESILLTNGRTKDLAMTENHSNYNVSIAISPTYQWRGTIFSLMFAYETWCSNTDYTIRLILTSYDTHAGLISSSRKYIHLDISLPIGRRPNTGSHKPFIDRLRSKYCQLLRSDYAHKWGMRKSVTIR